jgi:hypothetical protein
VFLETEGTCPADTLILPPGEPHQTSDLQNCKTINLCCFKKEKEVVAAKLMNIIIINLL